MADDGFWMRMFLRAVLFLLCAALMNPYFWESVFKRLPRKAVKPIGQRR